MEGNRVNPAFGSERDKWVVRVDGVDTVAGNTARDSSVRSRPSAAHSPPHAQSKADERSTERGTVRWLVRRYVGGRTDVTLKAREKPRVGDSAHRGRARCDSGRPSRPGGRRGPVDRGARRRRQAIPPQRADLPHHSAALPSPTPSGRRFDPAQPGNTRLSAPDPSPSRPRSKDIEAWDAAEVTRFLEATREHRWAVGFRLGVLYGLRRSEVLALHWDDLEVEKQTLRIDQSVVAVSDRCGVERRQERDGHGGESRSMTRRCAPSKRRRSEQATERLLGRQLVGGPRPHHRHPPWWARAAEVLRPRPGAGDRQGRRSSHHITRPSPYGCDAHGRGRNRHWPAPSDR